MENQTHESIDQFMRNRRYSREILSGADFLQRKVSQLQGGAELLKRLQKAMTDQEPVTVYGDYDADGIMATYILYDGLNHLRPGTIRWFINNRFEDGYGITVDSIKKCLTMHPETRVIITCDNGINAAEAVDYAMQQGITVLVTDHHVQTIPLREDCPAVDEKSVRQMQSDAEEGITPEEFCGAELARRVVEELYELLNISRERAGAFLESLRAFAAFATITDSVPMNASNHANGRKGLQIIQRGEGFWRLLREEYPDAGREIQSDTIGYYYGPLLNACGRISGSAACAMHMLLSCSSGDEMACRQAIRDLIAMNEQRREICEYNDSIAFSLIEQQGLQDDPFILLYDERFSEGVNGLTATHVTARYHVPCAVLSPVRNNPGEFKGSARSVNGCSLIRLFLSHPELIRAGGHAMAAGLSVNREDLPRVRKLLNEDMQDFTPPLEPEPDFTYEVPGLYIQTADWHKQLITDLEPFGPGFEEPRILFRGTVWKLWEKKKKNSDELVHATFPLGKSADGFPVQANWWKHLAEARMWFREGKELCCIGKVERNEYVDRYSMKKTSIQITIDHIVEE